MSQTAFDRPYVSPDGLLVGFVGDLEQSGTFFDDVLVVAPIANPSAGNSLIEGELIPGDSSGRVTNSFDQRVSVLNNGAAAFTTGSRIPGGTNVAGDSLLTFDSVDGTFKQDLFGGDAFGGSTVTPGFGIESPYLAPAGGVGAKVVLESVGNAVVFETTVYENEGDTPAGAPAATDTFDFETTYFGENGTSYLTQARSFPPNRTVDTVIVDGQSVIVGGQVLPGSGFNSVVFDGGPNFAGMNEAGLWYARGGNVDGTGWIVVEGNLVATEGDLVAAGSTETWAEFDGIAVDANGNYVVVGVTDTGNALAVYNGTLELAREGDSVGTGGLVLRDFSVDDVALGNAGDFVFAGRLFDANGSASGQALMTVAVPEPATAGLLGLAGLALLRRKRS